MWLPLFAVAALAFMVEAIVGFGATVVVVSLGSLFLPLDVLLPTFVPVNLALSAWHTWHHRAEVEWGLLRGSLLPPLVVGTLIGMFALAGLPPRGLLVAFGLLIITLSTRELWRSLRGEHGAGQPLAPLISTSVLLAGGLIHGVFGTGGPLIVFTLARTVHDKSAFRATLAVIWTLLNSILLGRYLFAESVNAETLSGSALLVGALFVGVLIGERIHDRADPLMFRRGLFSMLFVVGLALTLRNLLA